MAVMEREVLTADPAMKDVAPERGPFENEGLSDFSDPQEHQAFEEALNRVRGQFNQEHPLVIGGKEIWPEETFESVNPAHPDEVIGVFAQADWRLAEFAVEQANEAFQEWKWTPAEERAQYLFDAADIIRERKHEFSAWMVYEVGKNWLEADADTAEAIDFLEYYGRLMIRMDRQRYVQDTPGERDEMRYIPLGAGAVIPPWNFPMAIMAGMSSASIVAGNTIVLKPASTAPKIAWEFFKVMREVGLPGGVFNYLTGPGGQMGDALVEHPKTRFIAFTGSKEVGTRISERAGKVQPGQIWLKRTILEMGGKDAVVVDETADLEAAAEGIVVSAFGYQGQKCSAGSRAIIVDDVYDEVLEKVIKKTQEMVSVGDTDDPNNYMGPVIDPSAFQKIMRYIGIGNLEGKLVHGGDAIQRDGWFIEPTVFADVDPDAVIAQEEIFGPVVAVIRAEDFGDALEIANSTEYGLTGSLYSRDQDRIERAKDEFHVGNLYFNRKCTGALVGVHPFGGFNMSGTDSKAGGPDYLLLFSQAKAIGEKLV